MDPADADRRGLDHWPAMVLALATWRRAAGIQFGHLARDTSVEQLRRDLVLVAHAFDCAVVYCYVYRLRRTPDS